MNTGRGQGGDRDSVYLFNKAFIEGYLLTSWRRPRSITDPAGHSTRYDYDHSPDNPRGDVSRIIHPNGGEERLAYNSEGLIKSHIAQAGQTTRYTHGSFDLLRAITDPRKTRDTSRFLSVVLFNSGHTIQNYPGYLLFIDKPSCSLITEFDSRGQQTPVFDRGAEASCFTGYGYLPEAGSRRDEPVQLR